MQSGNMPNLGGKKMNYGICGNIGLWEHTLPQGVDAAFTLYVLEMLQQKP